MNEERFELLFRDRLLVKAVENRLDRTTSEVYRVMLRHNELSSDATSDTSALLPSIEGRKQFPAIEIYLDPGPKGEGFFVNFPSGFGILINLDATD